MAVNKVIYGGTTLVDLTGDTVTAADLADGVKATGADGTPIVGLMQKVTIDSKLSTTSTNPVQNKVIAEAIANIGSGGGGGVSTDTANTWTAAQTFNMLNVNVLGIACEAIEDKATITPTTSMTFARPTPELEDSNNVITLDLSNLAAQATFTNAKQFECIILNGTDKEYTINIKGINGALTLCSPSDIAINKGYGNCIFGKIYRFVDDAGNADGALIAFINAQKITDTM